MKLPKNIQCVIFDMDGVIIDSEEIHKKAYYETFNDIGVDVSDKLYKPSLALLLLMLFKN